MRFFTLWILCVCFVFSSDPARAGEAAAIVDGIVGNLWQGKRIVVSTLDDLVTEVERSLPPSRETSVSSHEGGSEGKIFDSQNMMDELSSIMLRKARNETGSEQNIGAVEEFLATMKDQAKQHPLAAFEALSYVVSLY